MHQSTLYRPITWEQFNQPTTRNGGHLLMSLMPFYQNYYQTLGQRDEIFIFIQFEVWDNQLVEAKIAITKTKNMAR